MERPITSNLRARWPWAAWKGNNNHMKQIKELVYLTLLATMFASLSMADVMPFQWSTTGTFSSPGLPSGLSFVGAPLSGVQNTAADGSLSAINLGHFNFADIITDYTGTFSLTVNFFRPSGSTDPAYSVTLAANANSNGGNDTLTINFPGVSQYSFNGPDGAGTFTFGVDNVFDFRNGSHTDTVNLTGNIIGATFTAGAAAETSPVPEPSSVLLLCTVLAGFVFMAKRRSVLIP
jgi:hypothetical protein